MLKPSSSLLLFPLLALGIYLGSLSFLNLAVLLSAFAGLTILWLYLAYRGKSESVWSFAVVLGLGAVLVGHMAASSEQAWITPGEGEFAGQ